MYLHIKTWVVMVVVFTVQMWWGKWKMKLIIWGGKWWLLQDRVGFGHILSPFWSTPFITFKLPFGYLMGSFHIASLPPFWYSHFNVRKPFSKSPVMRCLITGKSYRIFLWTPGLSLFQGGQLSVSSHPPCFHRMCHSKSPNLLLFVPPY